LETTIRDFDRKIQNVPKSEIGLQSKKNGVMRKKKEKDV